jgi:hypothetical protein
MDIGTSCYQRPDGSTAIAHPIIPSTVFEYEIVLVLLNQLLLEHLDRIRSSVGRTDQTASSKSKLYDSEWRTDIAIEYSIAFGEYLGNGWLPLMMHLTSCLSDKYTYQLYEAIDVDNWNSDKERQDALDYLEPPHSFRSVYPQWRKQFIASLGVTRSSTSCIARQS